MTGAPPLSICVAEHCRPEPAAAAACADSARYLIVISVALIRSSLRAFQEIRLLAP